MLGLHEWSRGDEPAVVHDMTKIGSWDRLRRQYVYRDTERPLARILEIAEQHGVVNVLVERRYIDADWRSQLASFYNGTLRRYPSVCHRLHFFSVPVPDDLNELSSLQDHYVGYTVLRPFPIMPVGRTMIRPPLELADAVRCEDTETVDVFGWPLRITAMPFISQDSQLLRCAHAAVWMVLRHAHLTHALPKVLPHDIYQAALGGLLVGRQLPNDGLSVSQLMGAMEKLGLSPTPKDVPKSIDDEKAAGRLSLHAIVCRYVNSSLPPIVISSSHAWVIVAYKRTASAGNPVIELWRHDDARGPYLPIDNPWDEPESNHRPWLAIFVPLLPKVYVDAERAEVVGETWLRFIRQSPLYSGSTLQVADLRPVVTERPTLRTFLVTSRQFKQGLKGRGVPPELAAAYRRTPMSRYIWVIEIVDRKLRTAGQPDVIGEILLDSTLTQFEPLDDSASVLALHVDATVLIPGIDQSQMRQVTLQGGATYRSACPLLASSPSTPGNNAS